MPQIIQGAFDPALLLTDPDLIKMHVEKSELHDRKNGWIANLGHGILPETPIENVEAFIKAIHSLPCGNRWHGA